MMPSSSTIPSLDLAVGTGALIGDDADIGGAVALQDREPAAAEFAAQRRRQGFGRDQRLFQRGNVGALARRPVEQDLQKRRRADIADRLQIGDRPQLLLGLAGAGRDDRAAKRFGGALDHRAGRGQMVGKGVVHEIAGAKPGGKERPREAAVIGAPAFRLVDRSGRGEDAAQRRHRHRGKPAKRRVAPLQLDQLGFAGQRQIGQGPPVGHILGPHPGEQIAIGRAALLRRGNDGGSAAIKAASRIAGIARFERIVERRSPRDNLLPSVCPSPAASPTELRRSLRPIEPRQQAPRARRPETTRQSATGASRQQSPARLRLAVEPALV